MKIIVLIKQVPDMASVKFDAERGAVDRTSAGAEINPFDLNALEAAVRIREELGGSVTALSMGPLGAEAALREAVARGADDGVLLSDKQFGGSDTLATSRTLAAGVKKLGGFDLIIAGTQTVDGDTGQVGAEVAELLGVPHIGCVCAIEEIGEGMITAVSDMSGSYFKKAALPALITVTRDLNAPRLPSLKSKLNARKTKIIMWGLNDLAGFLDESQTGSSGSPTRVAGIEIPPAHSRDGKIYRRYAGEAESVLLDMLREKKIL